MTRAFMNLIFLAVVALMASVTDFTRPLHAQGEAPAATGMFGDANGDGEIDGLDAQLILAHAAGLTVPQPFALLNADVNGDGRVSAIDAQIVLAFAVQSDVAQFRIGNNVNATPIEVSAITPALLQAGEEATITGTNFSTLLARDTVLVNGIAAEILLATTTQMKIRVPNDLPCFPAHLGTVKVRVNGTGVQLDHPVAASTPLTISTDQTLYLGENAQDNFSCLELPTGRYMIAVYNVSRSVAPPIEFTFKGTYADGLRPIPESLNPVVTPNKSPSLRPQLLSRTHTGGGFSLNAFRAAVGSSNPIGPLYSRLRAHQIAHRRIMLQEQELMRTLQARGAKPLRTQLIGPRRDASQSINGPSYAISTVVGQYSSVKLHEPDRYDTYTTLRTRTAYSGTKCVVLEDSTSALVGQIDAYYQKIGTECDNIVIPMLQQYFGNPLAMDRYTDNNGRIVMLFTPAVNTKYPNLVGFVTSCDFFDETACPASNRAEIFYAIAPTKLGEDYTPGTVSGWYWNIRSTVAHEIKHITSFAERLSLGPNSRPESAWLEEGTAQIASELFGRQVYIGGGARWKGEAIYRNTLYCELRPNWPECLNTPIVMYDLFAWLSEYAAGTDTLSTIDPQQSTIYGSGWLMARWAADHYATDEAAFFRALTRSIDTGIVNLEARTGTSWPEFLGRWALALTADANDPSVPRTVHSVPSWDIRDIYAGMSNDLDGQISSAPLWRVVDNGLGVVSQRSVASGSISVFGAGTWRPYTMSIRTRTDTRFQSGTPIRVAIWKLPD